MPASIWHAEHDWVKARLERWDWRASPASITVDSGMSLRESFAMTPCEPLD